MEQSSSRFKALSITAGFSFWFFIISSAIGMFSIETFIIFVALIIIITQIFAVKLSSALNIFAIINTKIFLGILFIFVVSLYGILFRILGFDLLRLKTQKGSYWLDFEQLKESGALTQY